MQRNDYLIKKKMYKYILPGVLMSAALQLGYVIDGIIVGNLLGSYGNSALSLAVPVVYFLQIPAILFGMGGAPTAGILLGKRDVKGASAAMLWSIIANLIFTLVFAAVIPLTSPFLAPMLAGGEETAGMVQTVINIYALGMPFLCLVMTMSFYMGVDNHPGLSAAMHITANVINVILDYVLIAFTPMGIAGSTLSTVLGYAISGFIFIPLYLKSKKRMLKMNFGFLKGRADLIGKMMKQGLPSLSLFLLTAVTSAILNKTIVSILGQEQMAVYAVANNTMLIVDMCLNGVIGVIATIIGVLYGEKDYFGMRKVVSRITKISVVICAVLTVVFLAFPQAIAALYGFSLTDYEDTLMLCLRLFGLTFVFYSLNSVVQNYYRTINQTTLAIVDTVLQNFLLKIGFALLFMNIFGIQGIFIGLIITEILTLIIVTLLRIILQKKGKIPQKGFMAIPYCNKDNFFDVTVQGGDSEGVDLEKKLRAYCKENGIDEYKANVVGIAAEEFVVNIGRYGYKNTKRNYIDVCLSKVEDKLILRIRDDGVAFNPLEYETDKSDEEIGGIKLVKAIADKLDYTRVLNMNNTVVEINLSEQKEASK